ncbi:MAG: hypothetical protein F6J93_37780 [Oscillatoria sp. SIO1A7]|nr:hypothetical protein [Oscillatoria sp. SIO1A7]
MPKKTRKNAMPEAKIFSIGKDLWKYHQNKFEARTFEEDFFGHYYSIEKLIKDFWLKTFKEHPPCSYDDKESFLDYLQEEWAINAAIEQTAFENEGFWLFVFEDGIFRR